MPSSSDRLMAGLTSQPFDADSFESLAEHDLSRWHALLAQVGCELAEPLTSALERVTAMTTTGRIDRLGLRALRAELDRARQAGIWSQQIARLASGHIRQSHERVHLTHTLQSVLAYRARELHNHGIQLTQSLTPTEAQVDASMLFGLLNALVDWWLQAAQGTIDIRVETQGWPEQACLTCRVQHHPQDFFSAINMDTLCASLSTLEWRLLEQYTLTMGVGLERDIGASHVRVHLQFPIAPPVALEPEPAQLGFLDSVNSRPLAGSHVLIVASRRDLRVRMRESLKSMGLILDFVNTIQDAIDFCQEGLPHAIVFDGALRSADFEQLATSIRKEVPEFVFIELVEGVGNFEMASTCHDGMAKVGRHVLDTALPSALVYELGRIM
ncbi:hypothetical protein [Aquabacterium sp.]|uniref:hypothetical protein n=1 Tax=Aquabacterium sp. TaxID=1872578 RepID=UPI003B698331